METGDDFTYHLGTLPDYCFSRFEDMRRKKKFCDINIKLEDRSITVHRLVLSAAIPYFNELLENQKTANEQCEISVVDVDPESLESLIDFAYTSKLKITPDNAKNLLSAATSLKIDEVRDACCNFLTQRLTPENALVYRELNEELVPKNVLNRKLVPKNVLNEVLVPGIYAVSTLTVLTLQRFDPNTEEWISETATSIPTNLCNGALVAGNSSLYFSDAVDIRSRMSRDDGWLSRGRYKKWKKNFGAATLANTLLYRCGGVTEEGVTNTVDCCDLKTGWYQYVASMVEPRNYPGALTVGRFLYVLGGANDDDIVRDTVARYDPKWNRWVSVEPMLTQRCRMGCTALGGRIYVCGGLRYFAYGLNKEEPLASAEVYDILKKKWSYISPMKTARFACSLAAHGGKLYAVGGYDEDRAPLSTTEIYDPETDEWKFGVPFSYGGKFVQAVSVGTSVAQERLSRLRL